MRDFKSEPHLTDEDLLMAIDGELSGSREKQIEEHLAACWDCRARRLRLETTIANFVEARHIEIDGRIPADAGRRALVKANLAELAAEATPAAKSRAFASPRLSVRRALVVALAAAAAVVFLFGTVERIRMSNSAVAADVPLEPLQSLTPGAVRAVSVPQVCGATIEDNRKVLAIPASLKQRVFSEYGLSGVRARDFEVDFLITPELGGSNDIRNLWPEPYHAPVWNAHVKDELEDRLREMVCDGQIDLSTAQHDISADWILAYKKYFHTDRPL